MELRSYYDFALDDYKFLNELRTHHIKANSIGSISQSTCERFLKHLINEFIPVDEKNRNQVTDILTNEIAKVFVEGAKKITFGALIVGISAGIGIVMTNGKIIHTIVHALASTMEGMPKIIAVIFMYIANIIINTFITSGSGQAAAVMPLMSPLASVLGITQQCAVLAFQLGDGFTNQVLPMSSVLMAGLAFGGIPYGKWLKFFWKWLVANLIIGGVFLIISVIINWGVAL